MNSGNNQGLAKERATGAVSSCETAVLPVIELQEGLALCLCCTFHKPDCSSLQNSQGRFDFTLRRYFTITKA